MACVRGDKKAFMVSLSPETVRHRTSAIHAPGAYLDDSLVELRGVQATEAHFARSFEAVSDIDVEFHDTLRSGEDG